ncbi:MAG: homoserine O-acetyltransferase [Bacteroidota bacterium]
MIEYDYQVYKHSQPFEMECGEVLPEVEIAYCTFGELNEKKDNVVWICHALTANADPVDWWPGLVGDGFLIDPKKYFIVCANMLGSCYGSTGPTSINPKTRHPYKSTFPLVTIRDIVKSLGLLQTTLGINQIHLAIGGSMGGQQVVEWAIADSGLFKNICILASNAYHSAWGIAFNETQRMAIRADQTFLSDDPKAGEQGLEAARAIAMLSYRNYGTYVSTQTNEEAVNDNFKSSSYQNYQGQKLRKRFDVHSYYTLSKAMDSHNVSWGRNSLEEALSSIKANAMIIGIMSDILFPIQEQRFLAEHIPGAVLEEIDSLYGHDGFLIETKILTEKINKLINYD